MSLPLDYVLLKDETHVFHSLLHLFRARQAAGDK